MVGREVAGVNLDPVRKAADARFVEGQHHIDEMFGRLLDEREVGLHAAAAIEEHDHGDRLDVVGEERQCLPFAVVDNREGITREIRHESAVGARDRGVHRDRAVAATECRLLRGDGDREQRRQHQQRTFYFAL